MQLAKVVAKSTHALIPLFFCRKRPGTKIRERSPSFPHQSYRQFEPSTTTLPVGRVGATTRKRNGLASPNTSTDTPCTTMEQVLIGNKWCTPTRSWYACTSSFHQPPLHITSSAVSSSDFVPNSARPCPLPKEMQDKCAKFTSYVNIGGEKLEYNTILAHTRANDVVAA